MIPMMPRLLAILCGALLAVNVSASDLDAEQLTELAAGAVLLENAHTDQSGGSARVRILINAEAEDMWGVFMSCEHAFTFLRGLQICEVLEESEQQAVTRQVVDRGWLTPKQDYTFETRRIPYHHMEFSLLEGSLDVLEGSWKLQETEQGLLVTHEIRLKPRAPAPRWLIRRTVRRGLPDMMQCIRGLVENRAVGKADSEDLAQCPHRPAFP